MSMDRFLRGAACALLAASALGGCATQVDPVQAATKKQFTQTIVPGRSTKLQIYQVMGPATIVRFDSGYEVWRYGESDEEGAEFVILFDSQGVVKKTRRRLATPKAAR
ncbi:MAG: hypothetical protein V4754_00015 [Pseudomonadota bacterium]